MALVWNAPVKKEKGKIRFIKKGEQRPAFTIPTYFFRWIDGAELVGKIPEEILVAKRRDLLNMLSDVAIACNEKLEELSTSENPFEWYAKQGLLIAKLTHSQKLVLGSMYFQQFLEKEQISSIQQLLELVGGLSSIDNPTIYGKMAGKSEYYPSGWAVYDRDYDHQLPEYLHSQVAGEENPYDSDPLHSPLWLLLDDLIKFGKAFKLLKIISSAIRDRRISPEDWKMLAIHFPVYGSYGKGPATNLYYTPPDHKARVRATVGFASSLLSNLVNSELNRISLGIPQFNFAPMLTHEEDRIDNLINEIKATRNFLPTIRINFPDTKSVLWHWLASTFLTKSELSICADCDQFFVRRPTGRPAKFCNGECENRTRQRNYQRKRRARERSNGQ